MRCDECQSMIEAYFDGELDAETGLQLVRHLDDCAACASLLQQLKMESEVYLAYEPPVKIRPDLWALVQSRIIEKRPPLSTDRFKRLQTWMRETFALPQVSGWATAALVLIAIGLTVTFMKYVRPKEERAPVSLTAQSPNTALPAQSQSVVPDRTTEAGKPEDKDVKPGVRLELNTPANRRKAPVRLTPPAGRPVTPEQLVREAEQKYVAAIAMLTRTVDRKRPQLDAPTRARLEQTLASVDRTIAGTRKVVRQHPNDPVAVQYMLNAYSRKVDVLREIIGY